MGRQKEKNYSKSVMNDIRLAGSNAGRVSHRGNVTPASSGRVDGPAACTARRGPDGVRGVVDFCDPAKIHDSPGLPTGGTLSAGVRPEGKRATSLPGIASGRQGNRRHPFPADGRRTEHGTEALRNPPYWGSVCIPVGRILGCHRIGGRQNMCA